MTVTLHEALQYHDRGWAVLPIRAIGDKDNWKKPATKWKHFQTERPDELQVRRWFGDDNRRALAVLFGPVSGGLICRDFDQMAAYERWAAKHPDLARTLPTVETGRPGRHVYARADLAQIRRHKPDGGGEIELGDGELRLQSGSYCLLPPSLHHDGPAYRWTASLPDEIPLVDLETIDWLPCNRENRGVQREPKTYPQSSLSSLLHEPIEMAIARTLPATIGQRNRKLFELARELKSMPSLADVPLATLKPIVRKWHQSALPVIGTKPFDDTWFDFGHGWEKVKFPKGQEPIAMLFEQAQAAELPELALAYEIPKLRLLVVLCRELQRATGDRAFYLSCRTAGRLLDVQHTKAWGWLNGLCRDDVLTLVSAGSQAEHKASRYRYRGPL